jgi:hypothetical protein
MNFKSALVGLALAASFAPAMAVVSLPNGDQTIDLSSFDASFKNKGVLLEDGDDVITFSGLSAGTYDFSITVIGKYISNLGASLNGVALDVDTSGPITRRLILDGQGAAPFELLLTGSGFTNIRAGYSVDISVATVAAAVPEPETYAMLLAGLGLMGGIARRRIKAAAVSA